MQVRPWHTACIARHNTAALHHRTNAFMQVNRCNAAAVTLCGLDAKGAQFMNELLIISELIHGNRGSERSAFRGGRGGDRRANTGID